MHRKIKYAKYEGSVSDMDIESIKCVSLQSGRRQQNEWGK